MTKTDKFVDCYIGMGSNLGDSKHYLQNALNSFGEHQAISSVLSSGLYRSKPHGPQNQPDYINAVVHFETTLGALELLDVLQSIENKNERKREGVERWGARTLDLDLLLYGHETINSKRLEVPHPRICERAFVLLPLQELVDQLGLKGLKGLKITKVTTLQDCIDNLPATEINDLEKLSNG